MQAIILCGGTARRMLPITEKRPKVLVPLMNKPLLERTIEWLPESIEEVFITINYRSDDIKAWVTANKKKYDKHLEVVIEDRKLGTAGAIKNVEDKLEGDFLVVSGDVVSSLDVGKLVSFHTEKKADLSIALYSVPNPSDYGIVGLEKDGRVNRFTEKPKPDLTFSTLANTGIYVSNNKMLEFVPRLSYYDISSELLPYILKRGFGVYGYQFTGHWMDLGVPERLLEAHRLLMRRTMMLDLKSEIKARVLPPVIIGEKCKLDGTVGPEVCIGRGVTSKESKIMSSVIYDGVDVGNNAIVRDSIVCPGCKIGNNAIIEGAVLGDNVTIAAGVKVSRGARVWSGQTVKKDIGEDQFVGGTIEK